MILLDTDDFSVFMDDRDPRQAALKTRLEAVAEPVACSIVAVEEMLRGWLALIHRVRNAHRQIPAYVRLRKLLDVVADWEIVGFDELAANLFADLRRQGVRIGSMDLKIACIAIQHDALLLTANLRDFSHVPQLRFDNWLKS
jgi:tRNA(fMet)-specific endonuclease VapC